MSTETWTQKKCPDCSVGTGDRHQVGCDVARCRVCGWQALGCEHGWIGTTGDDVAPGVAWSTKWTGRWPGDVEVAEGLASDLNDLAMKAAQGELTWDREDERWKSSS